MATSKEARRILTPAEAGFSTDALRSENKYAELAAQIKKELKKEREKTGDAVKAAAKSNEPIET